MNSRIYYLVIYEDCFLDILKEYGYFSMELLINENLEFFNSSGLGVFRYYMICFWLFI